MNVRPIGPLVAALREQGAVIAAVLRSPGFYNPADEAGRERLENRWNYVLNGMVEEGWLTAPERAGMSQKLITRQSRSSQPGWAQRGSSPC